MTEPLYNKHILVTGGSGFIGSHLVNHLVTCYPEYLIINYDALYHMNIHKNIKVQNAPNYVFIRGNLVNFYLLQNTLIKYQIDHVIHVAAQTHVDDSFISPLTFTQDNIVGTHTLLECMRTTDKKISLLHISTDEVLGEGDINNPEPLTETSIRFPTNPYSASKAAAEMLVLSYHTSFKFPVIITRSNNVYGPGQVDKVIPKFIDAIKRNEKLQIHGNGQQLRSYLHVTDAVHALDVILHKGRNGEIYHISSDIEMSVLDVARNIILTQHPEFQDIDVENYLEYIEDRQFQDHRYFISCEKLKLLGWHQEINFQFGLSTCFT